MKKLVLALVIGGVFCKPLVNTSPIGSGGPAEDSFQIPRSKTIQIEQSSLLQNQIIPQEVEEIIAIEVSKDAALSELLDIRTVEMTKPDIWPVVGIVTSEYGWRVFRGQREFHTGIDIAAPYGTPVSVTSDGKVIYVGWISGYGKTVIVYHGHGFVTLYGHLSNYAVNYGDKVVKGQIVGFVGMTGRTSGPHLHYEVIRYGNRQNPIAYLP